MASIRKHAHDRGQQVPTSHREHLHHRALALPGCEPAWRPVMAEVERHAGEPSLPRLLELQGATGRAVAHQLSGHRVTVYNQAQLPPGCQWVWAVSAGRPGTVWLIPHDGRRWCGRVAPGASGVAARVAKNAGRGLELELGAPGAPTGGPECPAISGGSASGGALPAPTPPGLPRPRG